nr:FHA domain-containing protein [Kofleriaceae bacterium]
MIQDDEGKTTVVPLIRDEITIGRKEGNTIRLTERNVSRRHARILRNNGEVQIEDLGSYNGIRVNNARIAERVSLRVSDQVQIGDYKLYLKAEGIEQVDDARTMPIERVADGAPTEAMAAVGPAPTGQVPVQAPPPGMTAAGTNPPPAAVAAAAAAPLAPTPATPLVGAMNRTLVAMDGSALQNLAAQRPIADPALVAKLTETASYGRLVVVSSNFAGKEYELSRPQMIIGRTDENDIVVNHRSISRNHAKVVRDPDNGRYTISDLQSSNGVRVNGTDYGKVELRRGDNVDLGHVRLRFIEPGEDFVFARDAEIMDVPEGGGKRGLLVAVILGVILLGSIAIYLAMHSGGSDSDDPNKTNNGNGSTGQIVSADARGSDVAMIAPIDAQELAVTPIDAQPGVATPPNGSNHTIAPTGSNAGNPTNNDAAGDINKRCAVARAANDWDTLLSCAHDLSPYNANKANDYLTEAKMEKAAQVEMTHLEDAVASGDYEAAHKALSQVPAASSLRQAAEQKYGALRDKLASQARREIQAAANAHDCDKAVALKNKYPKDVQSDIGGISCTAGGSTGTTTPPPNQCANVQQLVANATAAYQGGNYQSAFTDFAQAAKCGDPGAGPMAAMAACSAGQFAYAHSVFNSLAGQSRNNVKQKCLQNHYDPELGQTIPH